MKYSVKKPKFPGEVKIEIVNGKPQYNVLRKPSKEELKKYNKDKKRWEKNRLAFYVSESKRADSLSKKNKALKSKLDSVNKPTKRLANRLAMKKAKKVQLEEEIKKIEKLIQ